MRDLCLYESSLDMGCEVILIPRIRVIDNTYWLVVNNPAHLEGFSVFEKVCFFLRSDGLPVDLTWVCCKFEREDVRYVI